MNGLSIAVILGTARPGRRSEAVAAHVLDVVKQRGAIAQLVDVADYPLAGTKRESAGHSLDHYREIIARSDGLVIVAPEYNHGYPGELKLLLDSEYDAYVRKPVGFVSVSAGLIGGARMIEQLRLVAAALRLVPVAPAVHVSKVSEAMDDQGGFAASSLSAVLDDMLDEIEWYARRLAPADALAT